MSRARERGGYLTSPIVRATTSAMGKFWEDGSFNMTITATTQTQQRSRHEHEETAAKVAGTALVLLIPIATLSAGASAAQKAAPRPEAGISLGFNRAAPNAWSSRLSGLPTGGAALFDGISVYGGPAFYNVPAAAAAVKQIAPNAWSSRLSGLPTGGAALYL